MADVCAPLYVLFKDVGYVLGGERGNVLVGQRVCVREVANSDVAVFCERKFRRKELVKYTAFKNIPKPLISRKLSSMRRDEVILGEEGV